MTDIEQSIQTQFFSWMERKVSPAQLSELYFSYSEIERFCLKIKVLKKPLFQTLDLKTIALVKKTVESNKAFRFTHKRNLRKLSTAIHYYFIYIKENQTKYAEVATPGIAKNSPHVEPPIQSIGEEIIQSVPVSDKNKTTEVESASNIRMVDFANPTSYVFAHPVYFEYFDKKHDSLKSWRHMYMSILQCLFEDYPTTISDLKGHSIGKGGWMDVGDEGCIPFMTAPELIKDGLYLETNLNASNIVDKVRHLLDLCNVDYENVLIVYQNTNITTNKSKIEPEEIVISSKRTTTTADGIAFFAWLSENQGMAETTCRSYVSAINGAERFAKEHHLSSTRLYGAAYYQDAKETVDTLLRDEGFISYNNQQHNRFRAAMRKYLQFLYDGGTTLTAEKPPEDTVDLTPYRDLIAERYPKGFRLESGIEMKKFRHFWEAKFGTVLQEDDDVVRKYISRIAIRHQDFVYLPDAMLAPDKKDRLLSYISQCFSEGIQAIYYDALFKALSVELQGERIYNADMLKTYLSYVNEGNYYAGRTYLATDSRIVVDLIDEVRDCLISHGTTVVTDDLCESLSHIPSDRVVFALSTNKEFVRNAKGEYFHADVVDISDTELSNIADLIQQAIDDKYFIAGNELIDAIRAKYPQILERQPQYSLIGMRAAIGYKLNGAYAFNGNIISESGKSLSMYDVYADYCKKHSHITLTELNNLKQALDTVIYFETVYDNTLRISQDEFVSKEQAMFDVEKTDEAIDRFCTGTYIPIAEISHFGSFPSAGFAWNSYLLEHYVASYSANYKLLHTGFNAVSCVGAIVKRNAGIDTFDNLITDVLAKSNITLTSDAALQYLFDRGFLARRRYTDIEQILVNATAIRMQKG